MILYKLGVLGRDIGYSLSPKIHQEFAKQFNYSVEYSIYDTDKDPLLFIRDFFAKDGFGLNITKPYKHNVAIEFSSGLVSANCIYEKGLKVCSTDGIGLLNDMQSKKIDYENMDILVYGLGGAAHSILETIKTRKKIYVKNRTEKKSEDIINKNNIFQKYKGEKVDLVINCASSLNLNTMKEFEHFLINQDGFIYDINYKNDTNSALEALSSSKKTNFHNGVGMLVEQAAECFRLWFDEKPSVEEVKKLLNERV